MPVGSELAQSIRKSALLRNVGGKEPKYGDRTMYETFGRIWQSAAEREKPLEAAKTIHDGIHTAVSIDAFIDRFSDDEFIPLVGKMLIALEIAKAERESSLFPKNWDVLREYPASRVTNSSGKSLVNPDDTWLGHFFRILVDGVKDPTKIGKDINIICFNYDRCIEHYLRHQIAAAYRMYTGQADEIVKKINIIHPYGTLGDLPINDGGYGDNLLHFGQEHDRYFRPEEIARNIKTYTERKHQPAVIKRIHDAIADCHVLTFLGFGFNNQNLNLLRIPHARSENGLARRVIYSSGHGIAREVRQTLNRRIMHLLWPDQKLHNGFEPDIHVEHDQTCLQLFRTHNMNFSSFTRGYFAEEVEGDEAQSVVVFERGED